MTREEWLMFGISQLRDEFRANGAPVPRKIRASCSWPSKGALAQKKRVIGEAWSSENSGDGTFEVFISPVLKKPVEVLGTLVHELVHCAIGIDQKHNSRFRALAVRMGLEGKMTAAVAGDELAKRLRVIAKDAGKYPHAELVHSNAPKKQGTRMLKLQCNECGYTVRTTQKWVDVGLPTCPCDATLYLAEEEN
ncbi:MAG: transcription elongation protein SprT [bacterium]|nr:transcription elongation protein SprT [bacterium]